MSMNCFCTNGKVEQKKKTKLARIEIKHYNEPPVVGTLTNFHKQGAGASKLENGNTNNSGNSGTINYNFYANNYTDAIDLSGAMSKSESSNGPGQGSYTHQSQKNDIFGLLSSGLNAVSNLAPLLADPKTEEYEQSDRVEITQAGTSTIITQATVGTSGYRASNKLPKNTTAAADEPTMIGPSGNRFVTKVAKNWTTTQSVYQWQALHLPIGFIKAQSSPAQVMALRHHLLRCGWEIQVQVNSTRFHGGALGIFMVPEFVAHTSTAQAQAGPHWYDFEYWYDPQQLRNTPVNTITTTGGQYVVNPGVISNSNLAPEALFAFPHQILNPRTNSSVTIKVPYVGCTPATDMSIYNPWAIVIVVLRRLQYAAGATPALTITCSICPTNLTFHGLREAAALQGPIPVQNTAAQQEWTNTQPETAKPVYPDIFAPASEYLPAEFSDYTQLSRIPCLVKARTITVTQTKGTTAIYQCPIRPLSNEIRPTLLGSTSALFCQWRGSIVFRVVFTGNQMQNVRVVLCYTPPDYNNAAPATMAQAMLGHYVIYDTGIDSAAVLDIPYISMADFTPVWCPDRDGLAKLSSCVWTHGWFTIWQYTDLAVPPGSPTTADFLVFAYAGQDFSLKGPASYIASIQGNTEKDPKPLRPGEDGASTAADPQSSNENPQQIPEVPVRSSSVRNYWNRFFYVKNQSITSYAKDYYFDLDPYSLFKNLSVMRSLHATYFKADLDITLKIVSEAPGVATGKFGELFSCYVPPGACAPGGGSYFEPHLVAEAGALPFQFIDLALTNTITFSIPYTSVAAAVPTAYAGGISKNIPGCPPNLNMVPSFYGYGAIVLRVTKMITSQPFRVLLFVRFRNMRTWCPRPGYPTGANTSTDDTASAVPTAEQETNFIVQDLATKQGATNFDLLMLAGDVEQNPGPPVLSAMKILQDPTFQKFCDQYEGLKAKYNQLEDFFKTMTADPENKFVKKIFKFVGMGLLAYRAAKDPLTMAAIAFILGSDFMAWAVRKVIKWLKDTMTTPPPPFAAMRQKDQPKPCCCGGACSGNNPFCNDDKPDENLLNKWQNIFKKQGLLQDANAVINLCKGAEWISQQLRKIYDWIVRWKQQEEEQSPEYFQQMMAQYPTMFVKYRQCRNNYRHPERQQVAEYFEKLRKLAAFQNPRLIPIFPTLDEAPLNPTRPEPVVLLLKGKPGQGKSVAAELLAKMLSQTLTGKRDYFSFNAALQHFDGYQQQPVVVLDDLGQNPDGLDFKMFCQLVSTTTCVLPMADLADKGREFKSEILICTTNLPALNPVTISDPKALERRIFIECEVEAAQAYQKYDGSLDLARALKPTGNESPNTLLDTDRYLFHSDTLKFIVNRGKRPNTYSLVDIFNLVKREVQSRQEISCNLDSIFTKQAPKDIDESLHKLIEKWKKDYTDPGSEDVLAMKVIELCHGCNVLREYTQWFAKWKVSQKEKIENAVRTINLILASIVTVLSLLTILYSIYQICKETKPKEQSAYGGNLPKPKPRSKSSLLEQIQLQAPGSEVGMEATVARKNLLLVPVRKTNGKVDAFHMLAVGNGNFVTNYHQWESIVEFQIQDKWFAKDDMKAVLGMVNDMESDVVMFKVPGIQSYRNIVNHFYTGHFPRGYPVRGIDLHTGNLIMWSGTSLCKKKCLDTWEGPIPSVVTYQAQTYSGYCGAPVFIDTGISKKICGIHCAGTGTIGSAAELTQEMVLKMFNYLESTEKQGKIWDIYKMPFIYTPTKTSLKPTITCVQPEMQPAALSPFDKRLLHPELFKAKILAKHVGDTQTVPAILVWAARHYAAIVKSYNPDVAQKLTIPEAVNGIDGLDAMDFDKSPGYPYLMHGLRRKQLVDGQGNLVGTALAEYEKYTNNQYEDHIFTTFLKDELRPMAKVVAGSTRVIDIASFPHAVRGRVLFGNLFATFHKNPSWHLGSAVGCNPDVDWTRFYMTSPSMNILAMDYSGFDSTHSSAMFGILKIFLQQLGYDKDAFSYIDSLCHSRHIWDDEHYRLTGGLPSGCAGTTIFNTVLNNIVARAALKFLEVEDGAVLCYGDDILVASEDKFSIDEWKNFFGLTPYRITAADKGIDIEWKSLTEVTFLKRKFVMDHGMVRPQMDKENIRQLMMWARPGTLQEKIQSMARIAVHNGKASYEQLFEPFQEVGFYIPPFENLDEDFKSALM
uniref:Genome polyprotein n=1 Tax=Eidolon dupreanum teschovirus TaxID=3044261 RepID=A0AA49FPA4_9PICO|nr:MAG: polyprotein [Eidolon dupreanum teschovirus]